MGQHLRVVGWLRFGNKAQLTKGLRGFAEHAAPEYYDENSWEVEGLDARLLLDTELPGDLLEVETSFLAMVRTAAFGYVDYLEEGNRDITDQQLSGPIKRWHLTDLRGHIRWFFPSGSSLRYPEDTRTIQLAGACTFADAAAAAAAVAAPFRLPFLDRHGVRELRLGRDVFSITGTKVSLRAAVTGPFSQLYEPLREVLASVANKAVSGELLLRGVGENIAVGPKIKLTRRDHSKPMHDGPDVVTLAPVDAKAPLTVLPSSAIPDEAAPADDQTASGRKKAARKTASTRAPAGMVLDEQVGPVDDARLLATGQLLTWGGVKVTTWSLPALTPLHTIAATKDGRPWAIEGILELPNGRVVVWHEHTDELELLDIDTGEVKHLDTGVSSSAVASLAIEGARVVRLASCGALRIWSSEGELLLSEPSIEGGLSSSSVKSLGDGTVLLRSDQPARRVRVDTGEVVETLGRVRTVHDLGEGRYVTENYGEFELRGGKRPLSFELDKGNSHRVRVFDEAHVIIMWQRSFGVVSLLDGSSREIRSGHSKDVADVIPLGDGFWATHGQSTPALNERFGFDGTLKLWSQKSWKEVASYDARAPIRQALPLANHRLALLFDDAVRGKEVDVIDARTAKLVATLKGPKKGIVGQLALPDGRLLVWSKDRRGHVLSLAAV